MAVESKPVINVPELYQVCVVVRDLEKSIEHYQKVLGVGPWVTFNATGGITEMMYKGKPVEKFNFLCGLAMAGPLQIELIQPIEGELLYFDFLEEHGEGLHHIGHIRVPNLNKAVADMENAGFECIQRGRLPGGGFAYMDTYKVLGTVVELLELPEGAPAPGRQ